MSLQRGENIRGWEGVTRNIGANEMERDAWRTTLLGLILIVLVTGFAGLLMFDADIPTFVKAILILAVFLFTLKLTSGIYSRMMARAAEADGASAEAAAKQAQAAKARAAEKVRAEEAVANTAATEDPGPDRDGDGVAEGKDEGARPEGLNAARDGKPDDLKLIKGVGPKLEALCNSLGFWHFDQIAAWTSDEIAWVDSNLEGFTGRVTRDNWVAQAKILAEGGETEFSKRQ